MHRTHTARHAALALLAFVLPLLVLGCGTTALQRRTYVAESADDVAKIARELVLEARGDALRTAARLAREAGEPVEVAVTRAAEEFDAGPMIGAYNLFVSAKDTYVRALLLRMREQRRPRLSDLTPFIADVAAAYAALRDALGIRGDRLPIVPGLAIGGAP